MPATRSVPRLPIPRLRRKSPHTWLAAARVLGLALLFLLPMQMRAGADDPHPHAMLHLLLDARDGLIDHHGGEEHAADPTAGHERAGASHQPDVPKSGSTNVAGGAMAILALLVVLMLLPAALRVKDRVFALLLDGLAPALEPPPPRVAGA